MRSMRDVRSNLDPELLQARWVLGGITPEEFATLAAYALEHGFEGTALRQLARLSRPIRHDLGNLPARVFAAMNLKPIDRDEAVAILIARGQPSTSPIMSALLRSFPAFSERWKEHVTWWRGKPAGFFVDMAQFVHFVVEDVHEKGNLDETRRTFETIERFLAEADQETRDLLLHGFFEPLQHFASWRPHGGRAYEPFFGPMSLQIWNKLQALRPRKSVFTDGGRARRENKRPAPIPNQQGYA